MPPRTRRGRAINISGLAELAKALHAENLFVQTMQGILSDVAKLGAARVAKLAPVRTGRLRAAAHAHLYTVKAGKNQQSAVFANVVEATKFRYPFALDAAKKIQGTNSGGYHRGNPKSHKAGANAMGPSLRGWFSNAVPAMRKQIRNAVTGDAARRIEASFQSQVLSS